MANSLPSALRHARWTLPVAAAGLSGLAPLALGASTSAALGSAVLGGGIGAFVTRSRSPRPARIDPFTVGEPWRRAVSDALKARARFTEAVSRSDPGPVRDRLARIGERVDEAVETCWRVSRHGQSMADARRRINVRALDAEVAALTTGEPGSTVDEQTTAALESQLATAQRLDAVIEDTRDQLRLLNARLDEAVARALELALRGDGSSLGPVGSDVEHVADELEALRLALDETDSIDDGAT
jgi:hypothetical protein